MKKINIKIYTPDEIQVANELAEKLNDPKSLPYYLYCAKKYPHAFLLDRLSHVLNLPDHKVFTTRPRLFTHLIQNSIYNTNDIIRD